MPMEGRRWKGAGGLRLRGPAAAAAAVGTGAPVSPNGLVSKTTPLAS